MQVTKKEEKEIKNLILNGKSFKMCSDRVMEIWGKPEEYRRNGQHDFWLDYKWFIIGGSSNINEINCFNLKNFEKETSELLCYKNWDEFVNEEEDCNMRDSEERMEEFEDMIGFKTYKEYVEFINDYVSKIRG